MQISTALFGEMIIPVDKGLYEEYTLPLGGKDVTFHVFIFEGFLNEETAKPTALFLDSIPLLYGKARAEITRQAASEVVDFFVRDGIAETDEDYLLELFGVNAPSKITKEMFLAALELRGLHIWQNERNEVCCVLDFSLDEEYTDELLVVSFDQSLAVTNISHES